MRACVRACVRVHAHVLVLYSCCVCARVRAYVCVRACVHVYMHVVCVCVCVRVLEFCPVIYLPTYYRNIIVSSSFYCN